MQIFKVDLHMKVNKTSRGLHCALLHKGINCLWWWFWKLHLVTHFRDVIHKCTVQNYVKSIICIGTSNAGSTSHGKLTLTWSILVLLCSEYCYGIFVCHTRYCPDLSLMIYFCWMVQALLILQSHLEHMGQRTFFWEMGRRVCLVSFMKL